ncbi:ABC transporter substrate-binding protein [Seonamhaeicola sp.]|uniref:ABC transporter substrate-binding protein n=1 Tax=Seonamhaeicola sp. TaxID=1912245 RepID=UPI00262E80F4|nr:ABC transporter substrate-binding protein [Seonamhaeicola sp.]
MKTFYVILLFIVFFSCKSEEDKLRFSSWQSSPTEEKIVRNSLDSFSKEHPEVAYNYQPIPGNYPEKIQLMLGTGKAPDLFWLKGDTSPAYLSFDVLQSLDSLVNADPEFDPDDFLPAFKDAFKYKGKYYGFGKDFNAYVLFYNKQMFAKAGLTAPPKNWKELQAYSKLLTKDRNQDGKPDQYGFIVEPSIDMLLPFVFQNGSDLISDDNDILVNSTAFVEAVEFFLSLYNSGVATIPSDAGAGWNGDVFGRKQVAMVISGAWMIPYLKESYPDLEYGVSELPEGKHKATLAFTNAYVIPKQTKRLEAAWKMLSYMAGKDGMRIWTSSGIALPTRKSVAIENGFYNDSIFKVFMKSAEYAKLYKVNMQERWFDETNAAMQAMFYKKANPQDVLDGLAKRLENYKLK